MEWGASVKVQVCHAFQSEWGRREMHLEGTYRYHMSNETCIQEQILSESASHNYAIKFIAVRTVQKTIIEKAIGC